MTAEASSLLHALANGAAALAFVLGLLWLAYRGVTAARARSSLTTTSRGAPVRLALRQILPIDAKRRVHLLSCDKASFLILTGGPQDVVIGPLPADPS